MVQSLIAIAKLLSEQIKEWVILQLQIEASLELTIL